MSHFDWTTTGGCCDKTPMEVSVHKSGQAEIRLDRRAGDLQLWIDGNCLLNMKPLGDWRPGLMRLAELAIIGKTHDGSRPPSDRESEHERGRADELEDILACLRNPPGFVSPGSPLGEQAKQLASYLESGSHVRKRAQSDTEDTP